MRYAVTALAVLLLSWASLAGSEELSRPLVLVAAPELRDPIYGRSVLVVKPFGREQHLGFIVNRPTDLTLGKIFPEHEPSRKVARKWHRGCGSAVGLFAANGSAWKGIPKSVTVAYVKAVEG
jgi:hypothetical protein